MLMSLMKNTHKYKSLLPKICSQRNRKPNVYFPEEKSQKKHQISMPQLLQLYSTWKKCILLLQIQTIYLMLNHFSLHILCMKFKMILILIQWSRRFVNYQVTVIQSIYLYIVLNVTETRRSTIFQISIMKKQSTSVLHHFYATENIFRIGLKSERYKYDNLE